MTLVGELSAQIRLAGKQQFDRDLESAGRNMGALARTAEGVGRGIKSGFATGAVAVGVVGVATAGLVTTVFKTGLAYNQLQQTSRAALKTLLGGAEAANKQMDKLDDFARTSPFSKEVFVKAQQQLIGFGLDAEKVVPTLDAMQNAVAAFGGSSQQLGELVFVLAQIRAAGKITGQDLIQFGQRGVDAAGLIGVALGKTGAQIREDITAGALDAGVAIDALVQGMNTKFAGAAANVKQQFTGAKDRVKAAVRDIGSALAEPFIGSGGGGLFVEWGNQLADILRALQAQTTPFTNWVTGQLNPAFQEFSRLLESAKITIQGFSISKLNTEIQRLSSFAPAIGLTAGAIAAIGSTALNQIPVLGRLFFAINPVVGAIGGLVAASPELRAAGRDLIAALSPLIPVAGDVAKALAGGIGAALPVVVGGVEALTAVVKPVVSVLEAIPAPVLAGAAAFTAMFVAVKKIAGVGTPLALAVARIGEQMAVQASLAQAAGTQISRFGALSAVAATRVTGLGIAMKAAFISNPIGLVLTALAVVVGVWGAASAAAAEKVQKHKDAVASLRDTLHETSGAITEITEETVKKNLQDAEAERLAKKIGVSFNTVVDAALGNKKALEEVTAATKAYDEANVGNIGTTTGVVAATHRQQSASLELLNAIKGQRDALNEAQQAQAEWRAEVARAAAAMSDAARNNQKFNDALAIARDTARDADSRIRALNDALDLLNGGTLTAQEAQAKLSRSQLSVAEAFRQTDAEGKSLTKTMIDGAGNINLNTEAGLRLFDVMKDAADGQSRAAISAHDLAVANGDAVGAQDAATAAAKRWEEGLRKQLEAAGLSKEAVDNLINTYLGVPEVKATLITDNGTIDEVQQAVLALTNKILATPDKTIEIDEPNSPAIRKALEKLGFTVKTLPDGKIRVSATGVQQTEDILRNLARDRSANLHVTFSSSGDPRNLTGTGLGGVGNADGGLHTYADGGMRSFSHGGGFPTGIFTGRPGGILKFAEPETRWEAFISGKFGQENRNRNVLAEAAHRLGMVAFRRGTVTGHSADLAPVTHNNNNNTMTNNFLNQDTRFLARDLGRAFGSQIAGLK